jgi:exodeoxyribonuclease VII large subunit
MPTYTVAVKDLLQESPASRAISVAELNRMAKRLLEDGIARIWVEGEVSNVARPASGHVYFTLKDEQAQVRCAWFRQRQRGPTIHLKNGDQVLVLGKVSIYEPRGDYQVIVEQVEAAGEGELRRRFEALKNKLAAEGLFDEARKSALPALPGRIGVVTSASGAAIRDIVTVLRRRFPAIPVIVYPTSVQGEAAAAEIVAAIDTAVRRNECDLLIVGRGGGSLEDLWPFNEEVVARAIADCPIPVISAVGHEVDVTIADFVADRRAPTPSGAAEIAVPDQTEWQRQLTAIATRIASLGRRYVEDRSQAVDWLARRIAQSSPAATVARQRDWLRNLMQVMVAAVRHDLASRGRNLAQTRFRLLQRSPAVGVQRSISRLSALENRLVNSGHNAIDRRRQRLGLAARGLDSVSPLATLERGYAIVTAAGSGRILTSASDAPVGTSIHARLAYGTLEATVSASDEDHDPKR